MPSIIRLAAERDADQLLEIYGPFCMNTPVSFELEPPSLDVMQARIVQTLQQFPWLVCESHGVIRGYVYASRHRERAAYQWSADVTAYIRDGERRRGVGRGLYTALFRLLVLQGYYNAYAGITLPNPASVGLHESLGFAPVGVYREVGFKLGRWHDVGWWQLALQPKPDRPELPRSIQDVRPNWDEAMAAGIALLRK